MDSPIVYPNDPHIYIYCALVCIIFPCMLFYVSLQILFEVWGSKIGLYHPVCHYAIGLSLPYVNPQINYYFILTVVGFYMYFSWILEWKYLVVTVFHMT